MLEAGFVFWGLFPAFGVIVAGYLLWMRAADRKESAAAREEMEP